MYPGAMCPPQIFEPLHVLFHVKDRSRSEHVGSGVSRTVQLAGPGSASLTSGSASTVEWMTLTTDPRFTPCPHCGSSSATIHPQTHLSGVKEACVDRRIAPLITELWSAGIDTDSSCEDTGDGRAQLVFSSAAAFERLLKLIKPLHRPGIDTLYIRVGGSGNDRWELTVLRPTGDFVENAPETIRVAALLPASDLELVMQQLRHRSTPGHPRPSGTPQS